MIHQTREGPVAILRMEHGKAQALDTELLEQLSDALHHTEADPGCHGIVLMGTGTIFSAGVDLHRVLDGGAAYLDGFLGDLRRAFKQLFAFPKPAVAAINGHAIAGGCVIACACDHRLMAKGAGTIGVPELKVGVPFPGVAIEILRCAVPRHLTELIYFGKTYGVDDAERLEVIHEAVDADTLLPRAVEIAAQLGSTAPDRFRLAKRQLRAPSLAIIEEHERASDPEVFRAWKEPATRKAIAAYVAQRLRK